MQRYALFRIFAPLNGQKFRNKAEITPEHPKKDNGNMRKVYYVYNAKTRTYDRIYPNKTQKFIKDILKSDTKF